ncbi:MAG: hypothetical protein ACI9C4_001435 [Paraglaciecola sp.]|jgi:hypothetical protein
MVCFLNNKKGMTMDSFKKILAISMLSIGLVACNDDDDLRTSDLRIIHSVPDAPTVNVYAGGAILAGLENVDYQVSSPWITVDEGTYEVRVEANVPGGNTDVISASLLLEGEMSYTVLAVGSTKDDTIEPLVLAVERSAVTAGNVRVQIVHAAAAAPTVDIYVTESGADINVAQPLATASFKDDTGQVEVAGGDYQIRIAPAGSKDVLFDSGNVTLPAGADLLVAATQNTGTGTSALTLLVSDGTAFFKIWDVNSKANIRVVHGVSDAPPVDIIANNTLTLFDGVAYPDVTGYKAVNAGDYVIDVAVDADNSIVAIDDAPITVENGTFYTAFANSDLATIGLGVVVDDPRPIATAAKVRIFHASPDAASVDIYVTADGDISAVSPTFMAVGFTTPDLTETGYVELAPGDYFITVTGEGSKAAVIETGILSLEVNKVYTAIAIDGLTPGAGPTLITADDLAPAFNATSSFNISLSGQQEVPMVDTMSVATAVVEIDESLPAFKVTLDASMVTDASAAHVHDGDIGTNGGVAFSLTDMGNGTFVLEQSDITAGLLADLLSGQWYLNVHTPTNAGGEVRGQIVPDTTAVVTFKLSGLQQIPQVMSQGTGGGYALFDTTDNGVTLRVVTSGVDDATMAHIHTGYAGVNGSVLVALAQDSMDANVWSSGGEINLDVDTAELLLSGGHYVNVHTPANPGGELRGQITPSNIEVYGVLASGDQEVPGVITEASGVGAITLNTTTGLIIGTINLTGITPTMAHIHAGVAGTNGAVVLALTDEGDGTFTVPANTALNMTQIDLMQSGSLYTNFHTTQHPSGEIRGQITLGF